MQGIAIVVGAVIAVAGWIASGELTRRAMRRQTQVEYLLSAYRRLEAASNRRMSVDHEGAIESAVSDIQLLGTARQVELAEAFSQAFAGTGNADTSALLEELRRSLRQELDLERVPERRSWLRISREGQWAEERAFVQARLRPVPELEPRDGSAGAKMPGLIATNPANAVSEAFDRVQAELRERVAKVVVVPTGSSLGDLVQRASQEGIITKETAEAVEGLAVMRNLASTSRRDVSQADARDFIALVEATLYAMRHEKA